MSLACSHSMSLVCSLAKSKLMSWAQSHSTFLHSIFPPPGQFCTYQLKVQWNIEGRMSWNLCTVSQTPSVVWERQALRRLPATTHTTVLVTPRTRHSQWLGRYTDKITHSPATSPFPTFIKMRSSYLIWTVLHPLWCLLPCGKVFWMHCPKKLDAPWSDCGPVVGWLLTCVFVHFWGRWGHSQNISLRY